MGEPDEICSAALPKALALHGHNWETSSWGVLIGVSKCVACGVVSTRRHFGWACAHVRDGFCSTCWHDSHHAPLATPEERSEPGDRSERGEG